MKPQWSYDKLLKFFFGGGGGNGNSASPGFFYMNSYFIFHYSYIHNTLFTQRE